MATSTQEGGEERRGETSSQGLGTEESGKYECNVCFDTATDAVVSMCGHLFW